MIKFTHKGDFKKTKSYFEKLKKASILRTLNRYGEEGVNALKAATPVDSGFTASCWYYDIETSGSRTSIVFKNSNIVDNVPIALILQYGHGTGTGGYIQGRDYINPAIQPLFDKLAKDAWEEVTKL